MAVQPFADQKLVALGSAATVAAVMFGAWWYKYQKTARTRIPTKWIKIADVEELFFYPVKSCGPMRPVSIQCTNLGFRIGSTMDRTFLVIRAEDGSLATGRELPLMTQITAAVDDSTTTLTAPDGSSSVTIDFNKVAGVPERILIWKTWTNGVDCGDDVATWLSQTLLGKQTGLRLLYACSETGKTLDPRLIAILAMEDKTSHQVDGGKFADMSAFHLISEASVRDLNTKLKRNVVPLNFRPNIVIKGEKLLPYEEDVWDWVKIGDIVFQTLGPCTRCQFTTINPSNGHKDESSEPLKTLLRYRVLRDPAKKKITPSPAMGIHMGIRGEVGIISKGDAVYIPAIV